MGFYCGKEDIPLIDENYVTFTENGDFYATPNHYHNRLDSNPLPERPKQFIMKDK